MKTIVFLSSFAAFSAAQFWPWDDTPDSTATDTAETTAPVETLPTSSFPTTKSPTGPKDFVLNLTYALVAPDGFQSNLMLANGQIDFPIVVNKGDDVRITVNNFLDTPTSIHWHGMYQKGTPWMDGAGMITQCPIRPNKTLVYEFNVGNQTGTYWWHAHFKSQYINGLRGPFIINDPKDPYLALYDDEITITIAESYHNSSDFLLNNVFFNVNNTNAFEPFPESGLIGGVGQYDCSVTQAQNPACKSGNPLKKYSITRGKRYRIRLINQSAQALYTFSIDGHNVTVIESDGAYTVPQVANQINIHSAQRYSFILNANQTIDNYWIRATMVDVWGVPFDNGLNTDVRAILSYNGAASSLPSSSPVEPVNALNPFLLSELNGLTAADLPAASFDYNQTVYFSFNYGPPVYSYPNGTVSVSSTFQRFQGQQYTIPRLGLDPPPLRTLLRNNSAAFPQSINPFYVNNNKWVFLMIQNSDSMEHPFHLHGHTFYVLSHGNLRHQFTVPANTAYARRDTIQVPSCVGGNGSGGETGCLRGFVTLAILFDNPGIWLFHCHIEWHMAAGLVMTFINNGDDGAGLPQIPVTKYNDFFGTC